jgi:hypothetical protein
MLNETLNDILEKGLHALGPLCRHTGGNRRTRSLGGLLDKAGHRFAGLRPFAQPVLGSLQVHRKVVTLLKRLVGAQLLDELAVSRAAAISHNYTKNRCVLGPDPLHANFNCHKYSFYRFAASRFSPNRFRNGTKMSGEPSRGPVALQVRICKYFPRFSASLS